VDERGRPATLARACLSEQARAGGVGVLLVVPIGFVDGGLAPRSWAWLTIALAAAAGIGLLLLPWPRPCSEAIVALAALGGLAALAAASAAWAVQGASPWLEARRTSLYLAGLSAVLVLVAARTRRALLVGLLAGISSVVGWGLVDRVAHGTGAPDRFSGTLLRDPIGYPNALGLLAATGALLALGLAACERRAPARRALSAVAYVLLVALSLTESRGAALALLAGFVIALGFAAPGQRTALLREAVTVLPLAVLAALVAARAGSLALARVLAVGAVAAAALPRLARPRHVIALAALGSTLAVLALVVHPPSATSSYRGEYWRAALEAAADRPLLGAGAGSFDALWLEYRTVGVDVRDAHSLYVEVLAELGPPGLALVLCLVGAPLVAAVRRRGDPDAWIAAGGFAVFAVHAGLDWDWEIPVVTLAALGCAGALLLSRPGSDGLTGVRGTRSVKRTARGEG
jgi:O-antigen ligase